MEPTRVVRGVVAVMLAVTVVAGAVTLSDVGVPQSTVQEPSTDGPTTLAYTALQKTGTESFVVTVSGGYDSEVEPLWRIRFQRSPIRANIVYVRDDFSIAEAFANRHESWVRNQDVTGTEVWEAQSLGGVPADPYFPHEDAILSPEVNATVVEQTSETVTLHVNDTDTVFALLRGGRNVTDSTEWTYEGSLVLILDRDNETVRRATFQTRSYRVDERPGEWENHRYEFTDWGTTEVDRPPGVQYTALELLRDVSKWGVFVE